MQSIMAKNFGIFKVYLFEKGQPVNPIQNGSFLGYSRMGKGKKSPSLKSVTHI